ncbi:hypothetical protein JOC85_001284 [Bacillus mesophilus]|nr:hypothetical protein [Bacillus mesophilus]MBM7660512.1 hypothetical protein [Bacillus mesophilus]
MVAVLMKETTEISSTSNNDSQQNKAKLLKQRIKKRDPGVRYD